MAEFEMFDVVLSPRQRQRYHHGQYRGAHVDGTFKNTNLGLSTESEVPENLLIDDHQSPLRPSEYLELRIQNQLNFYKKRLPEYSKRSTASTLLLILGTIATTVVALVNLANWATIVTALTAGVTAWAEFDAAEKKQIRFSDTIGHINTICLWWKSLPEVDKASVTNVLDLVNGCENLIQLERQGWLASALSNDALSKKIKDANKASADDESAQQSHEV